MPMIRVVLLSLLASQAAPAARYRHEKTHLLNDLSVTPGDALPHADSAIICRPGYIADSGVRHVTQATKESVYRLYGVKHRGKPPAPPSCCEVDHLISLELGGSNKVEKLWPEPYPDATEKDKVENGLHWLVCHGKIKLHVAQRGIANNWVTFRDSLVAAGNWTGTKEENVR